MQFPGISFSTWYADPSMGRIDSRNSSPVESGESCKKVYRNSLSRCGSAALAILSPVKCVVPRFQVRTTRLAHRLELLPGTLKGARILSRYIFLSVSLPLFGRRGKCFQQAGQNIKDFACPENVDTLGVPTEIQSNPGIVVVGIGTIQASDPEGGVVAVDGVRRRVSRRSGAGDESCSEDVRRGTLETSRTIRPELKKAQRPSGPIADLAGDHPSSVATSRSVRRQDSYAWPHICANRRPVLGSRRLAETMLAEERKSRRFIDLTFFDQDFFFDFSPGPQSTPDSVRMQCTIRRHYRFPTGAHFRVNRR